MFDITKCPVIDGYKRCKTRDGRDVRILCEDVRHDTHTIVASVRTANNNKEQVYWYQPDGKQSTYAMYDTDLVNISIKKTLWVNVYDAGTSYDHPTKERADLYAQESNRRIARIKVEYEEGQFDE